MPLTELYSPQSVNTSKKRVKGNTNYVLTKGVSRPSGTIHKNNRQDPSITPGIYNKYMYCILVSAIV